MARVLHFVAGKQRMELMRYSLRHLAVAAAALAIATGSAAAQGKAKGKGAKPGKAERISTGDVVIIRPGRKVPPGLAKKPGQMPPGQYKKLYTTREGAATLGDVFGRHGYVVTRIVPSGRSQYLYYRRPDGVIVRAIVSPGTERLQFTNVPAVILRELLARLY